MAAGPQMVEALRAKVESYLREKGLSYEVRPDGNLWLRQGSTLVVINIADWGERTLVRLAAPVALNITQVTPELTRFLAEKNHQLLFGKFSLDTQGNGVWYEHVLLGDYLDAEELVVAVAAIALTADELDEEVARLSGGKRVADL